MLSGLLAGLLASTPETRNRVRRLLQIAPAIDQGRQNGAGTGPNAGLPGFSEALGRPQLSYPGRRKQVLVVHGEHDGGDAGCAPAQVADWVRAFNAEAAANDPPVDLLTPRVNHGMRHGKL